MRVNRQTVSQKGLFPTNLVSRFTCSDVIIGCSGSLKGRKIESQQVVLGDTLPPSNMEPDRQMVLQKQHDPN